ncbi:MAG: ATP-dependent DNA helicase PcrA, partial [Nitrospiria bacterium]
ARERLYITCTNLRRLYGSVQFNAPSRFVEEIPEELRYEVQVEGSKVDTLWERDAKRSTGTRPVLRSVPRPAGNPYSQVVEDSPYAVGVRVRHPVWGVGTIQRSEGVGDEAKVIVSFKSAGTKKLAVKFARLEPA